MKKIISNFLGHFKRNSSEIILFEGGIGAQILQTACFIHLYQSQKPIPADFSYFLKGSISSQPLSENKIIYRPWKLGSYGIEISNLEILSPKTNSNEKLKIVNHEMVLDKAIEALKDLKIRELFSISHYQLDAPLSFDLSDKYICIHMRRGDYLDVASHIVQDEEFETIAKKMSGILKNVVFLSDSPIHIDFQKRVSKYFKCATFLDTSSDLDAHYIMRKATILICSNSIFSLTAAILGENTLSLIPSIWFGINKGEKLQHVINSNCNFQILN